MFQRVDAKNNGDVSQEVKGESEDGNGSVSNCFDQGYSSFAMDYRDCYVKSKTTSEKLHYHANKQSKFEETDEVEEGLQYLTDHHLSKDLEVPRTYSLRPMFPNATALTNNTLAIQVATPTDSSVKAPSTRSCPLPALAVALATFEND